MTAEVKVLALRVASEQRIDVENLGTIADRAWYAWHCLPRSKKGKPPSWKSLEKEYGVATTTFSKLFSGERKTVELETLPKMASALRVSEMWLYKGEGEVPKLSGPLEHRHDRYEEFDPAAWAARAEAAGGVDSIVTPKNAFEAAVQTLLLDVSAETIRAVADEARGHENERPAHHWGRILRDREQQRRAAAPPAKKPRARPKPKEGATEKHLQPSRPRRVG